MEVPGLHDLCLYQVSSRGGGCNLTRFGNPEPGLRKSKKEAQALRRKKKKKKVGLINTGYTKLANVICGSFFFFFS